MQYPGFVYAKGQLYIFPIVGFIFILFIYLFFFVLFSQVMRNENPDYIINNMTWYI